MRTAAQLRDGEVERRAGIRGGILHATELSHDGLGFRVRHVEWMTTGEERLILTDETTTRDSYHEAVAELHRQHDAAADHSVSH